jgi:hypothetical protein
MNNLRSHSISLQQDTTTVHSGIDSSVGIHSKSDLQQIQSDTLLLDKIAAIKHDSAEIMVRSKSAISTAITDTNQVHKLVFNPFSLKFNTDENFLLVNPLTKFSAKIKAAENSSGKKIFTTSPAKKENIAFNNRVHHTANWMLLVFIMIVMLFIWIKIFYNKFFTFLGNSLSSYRLSAKVFREKNVLLKRVSLVLDVIYILVISFFIYEFFLYKKLSPLKLTSYNLFLLFLNILLIYTLVRALILNLFKSLFKTEAVVSEYTHNNFIINKSIGIVLFPLVFAVCYVPEKLVPLLLFAGLIAIGAGIIFKIIRGYQIIIRKDVLFIYLILYLCTLEILPLLLGYKVFMSLL